MPNVTATVVGYEPYTAQRGDSYDLLALQAYGEELRVPIIDKVETPETLPPWRR